jgi:hypothetical protein
LANGKPHAFYRCRHIATAGAHRGHQREFCVHNNSFVLGELKKGQHNHLRFVYDVSGSGIYEYEYVDVFRDANQIMVVFDATRAVTLTQCSEWLDGEVASRIPPREHGLACFEVSAKTSAGLIESFNELSFL